MAHLRCRSVLMAIATIGILMTTKPISAANLQSPAPEHEMTVVNPDNAKQYIERFTKELDHEVNATPRRAQLQRSRTHQAAGDHGKALTEVNTALAISPGKPEALDLRGQIYEGLGRTTEAVADYRESNRKAPENGDASKALRRLGITP